MILGRVEGSIWATAQHSSFDRVRLVIVVPWDPLTETAGGNCILAVDTVGSGPGDIVTVVYEGSSARAVLQDKTTPAEAVVVGIVDRLDYYTEFDDTDRPVSGTEVAQDAVRACRK